MFVRGAIKPPAHSQLTNPTNFPHAYIHEFSHWFGQPHRRCHHRPHLRLYTGGRLATPPTIAGTRQINQWLGGDARVHDAGCLLSRGSGFGAVSLPHAVCQWLPVVGFRWSGAWLRIYAVSPTPGAHGAKSLTLLRDIPGN